MDNTRIWHDITTSVRYALQERLAGLPEERLIARSDALLGMLPGVSGAPQLTTAAFLWNHDTMLHAELCRGMQPATAVATDAGQLHDLTRAVLVTGVAEGLSIEAAVGIALVLHTRGLVHFCARPATAA